MGAGTVGAFYREQLLGWLSRLTIDQGINTLLLVQDEEEDDEDEDDDDEEDDNNVMFDGVCRLFSREGQSDSNETSLGAVCLRIIYDDDVYGARIIAVDQEVTLHWPLNLFFFKHGCQQYFSLG